MEKEQSTNLSSLNPIRVETALSRFPVHRLARKGSIDIDIREAGENGGTVRWEVDYSKKHGQPGPLAYKLDTLIVNRRIEEAPRPIPRIIRLGSLRDICRELDISEGENVNTIRKALRQNAFAGITAKTSFKKNDGSEQTLEADFTRYSVIFTGEKLPDGRKADAVYIVLNDVFMRVINGAMTRPLDYDYLKGLSPAPQRFYELLSYQMYAALKYDRPRAKLIYSQFCSHAPQTRHFDWARVRSQMNKVHRPHRESAYIAEVNYDQTTDSKGQPDWIMCFKPGPKARAEFRAFNKRGGPVMLQVQPFEDESILLLSQPEPSPLEAELIRHGITPEIAADLVRDHDAEKISLQIEILDWRLAGKNADKIDDPAAYLVGAIKSKTGYAVPKGFVSRDERQRRKEATDAKECEVAEAKRRVREDEARERVEKDAIIDYWDSLTAEQQTELDAIITAQADPEKRAQDTGAFKRLGQTLRRHEYIRQLLRSQGKLPPESA